MKPEPLVTQIAILTVTDKALKQAQYWERLVKALVNKVLDEMNQNTYTKLYNEWTKKWIVNHFYEEWSRIRNIKRENETIVISRLAINQNLAFQNPEFWNQKEKNSVRIQPDKA